MRRANGEGSYDFVEKNGKNGVWRWRGYYTKNGEKKRKEIVATSRKKLREKVTKFLESVDVGGDGLDERISTAKWCVIWLERIVGPTTKARTAANYETTVRNHILPQWGGKSLNAITPLNIQDYLNVLSVDHKPSTVCTIRTHIIACFNAAKEFGYLRTNAAKQTRAPRKEKGRARALSEEEIHKLLEVAERGEYIYHCCEDNKWKENDGMVFLRRCYEAVVFLTLATGMRQGEVFGLKWTMIDFNGGLLRVAYSLSNTRKNGLKIESTKTEASQRNILLAKKSIKVLLTWKKYQNIYAKKYLGVYENKENLVFTNSYGNPISATNFLHRYFRKMLRAAEIDDEVRFHDLRHTHATQLLRAGVNVKVVSERLGHASVSTTMDIYAHALPDMQATAVKAIDEIFKK